MRLNQSEKIIINYMKNNCIDGEEKTFTTIFLSEQLYIERSNVSRILNNLERQGIVEKIKGKPVLYRLKKKELEKEDSCFNTLVGHDGSLYHAVKHGKASILYPNKNLNVILEGEKGVGKKEFAKLMHQYARDKRILTKSSKFLIVNCLEYADSLDELYEEMFIKEDNLFVKADKGVMFIEEIQYLSSRFLKALLPILDSGEFQYENKKYKVILIFSTSDIHQIRDKSYFLNKIPMIIKIPNLNSRPLSERFELVKKFVLEEAKKVNKVINISYSNLRYLILYNCQDHINQLKKDIKIISANAYANSILLKNHNSLSFDFELFDEEIQHGIFEYENKCNELNKVLEKDTIYSFNIDGTVTLNKQYNGKVDIYSDFESRINEIYKSKPNETIQEVFNTDINILFEHYFNSLTNEIDDIDQLRTVVDENLINFVSTFLKQCRYKLNKVFSNKTFIGLCIHLDIAIKRAVLNEKVKNNRVLEIIEKYPEEYALSKNFSKLIEKTYKVNFSIDEVVFITMFICDEVFDVKENGPAILILAHGNGIAKNMCKFVQEILQFDNIFYFDRPLNMSIEETYDKVRNIVKNVNTGKGVIILSDMGIHTLFASMLSKELNIQIKNIENVTTPLAIECATKAMTENNIDIIYKDLFDSYVKNNKYSIENYKVTTVKKENVIITICLTREGSAVKIKNIIEENVNLDDDIEIVPISIVNQENGIRKIKKIAENKNIIAIVGTVNPKFHNIEFIPISNMFINKDFTDLKEIINDSIVQKNCYEADNSSIDNVIEFLKKEVNCYDFSLISDLLVKYYYKLEEELNIKINSEKRIGIMLHLTTIIELIIKNEYNSKIENMDYYYKLYSDEIEIIQKNLKGIEEILNISFPKFEIVCLLIMLLELQ